MIDDVIVYRLGDRALPPRGERRQHRDGTSPGSPEQAGADATIVDRSAATALLALAGTGGGTRPRRRSRGLDLGADAAVHASATARWRASRGSSRGPATPARTASSSACRPRARAPSGTRCSRPRGSAAACPRPRRARHAAARGGAAALRQRHRRRDHAARGRARLGGKLEGRRSSAARRSARAGASGVAAPPGRPRAATEPGIPRHGYPVVVGDARVGVVTSGTKSPTLGHLHRAGLRRRRVRGSGHGAWPSRFAGDALPARVVARPFYRRPASGASHGTA